MCEGLIEKGRKEAQNEENTKREARRKEDGSTEGRAGKGIGRE